MQDGELYIIMVCETSLLSAETMQYAELNISMACFTSMLSVETMRYAEVNSSLLYVQACCLQKSCSMYLSTDKYAVDWT